MLLDLNHARTCLQNFEFSRLFVEELGWSHPSSTATLPISAKGVAARGRAVAELSGVAVVEIEADDGAIPNAANRAAIHKEVSKLHHENVLIFVDAQRSQSLWYWAKREDRKIVPRTHIYVRGQSGDLILSKLAALTVDFEDFDESGNVPLLEVTDRLKQALDIERVTKKFYGEFQEQHLAFLDLIEGIDDERDRRWYASVMLNRLMFIYFLQKKFLLDNGDEHYLQNKLAESREHGADLYYSQFLRALFFEGFAKPEDKRSAQTNAMLGKIRYLNGGLFLEHPIEQRWRGKIAVPDKAFDNLFDLFGRYSWNLNDTPGGKDDEINPDVLGYIFEKYINQKAFGAYYTRPEITEYLCESTIHRLILDGVAEGEGRSARTFDSVGDLLLALDAPLCRKLLYDVLPNLRLLDPACGSAAFLVSAMKTLINVYVAVIGKIEFLGNRELQEWLKKTQAEHKSVAYYIKRSIITNNLFGVDIMEEAVEIAKLRLFLALVSSAHTADDLEPLPNIEFNIMAGNSLFGLMRVDDAEFDGRYARDLFRKSYQELLEEKNELIEVYRRAVGRQADELQELRDNIQERKNAAIPTLNDILLSECHLLGIRYEEATWDGKKNAAGRPKKRTLQLEDIEALKPFHWGYEFDRILVKGGFDAIITNPPWEIFKPNAKEFFEDYSDQVSKKKMTIKEFEKEQAKLLKDPDIRAAWLKYLSGYPHVSAFFRSAAQYKNQISIVDGKKAGSDINLYKLFTEQCFNLLRSGGYCGIVIPSGIYTDLGTKQLREMLFGQTTVTGLFCIENRKEVFEGVHRSFKFVIMSFEKGGHTERFPAAFMRHDVAELERFPQEGAIGISVPLVRRLAPDSLSVMEFKNSMDVRIAEKMASFPLLGDAAGQHPVTFAREFDLTQAGASGFAKTERSKELHPLYEGKMIWQFQHDYSEPQYWVNENALREFLFGGKEECVGPDCYRVVFRRQSACTNERTLVATIIPPAYHADNLAHVMPVDDKGNRLLTASDALALCALFNSVVVDFSVRQRVTNNINFFFLYQLPVPRLTEKDEAFRPIVERAARLICTTPEFDDLAQEIFSGQANAASVGATVPAERAKLRAELDGLVAHLYGLTEEEFAHILTTFPLVSDEVKIAAHNAFRNVERGLVK